MGPVELILIVLALVLLFGARKLPELGKGFGQGIREFKKNVKTDSEVKQEPDEPVRTADDRA